MAQALNLRKCKVVDSGDSIKGQMVVATEDLEPGTLILQEEPFVFCLQ